MSSTLPVTYASSTLNIAKEPAFQVTKEVNQKLAHAFKAQKKQLELQLIKENYKNLSTQRVLEKISFDQGGYDKELMVYKPQYRYKNISQRLQTLQKD